MNGCVVRALSGSVLPSSEVRASTRKRAKEPVSIDSGSGPLPNTTTTDAPDGRMEATSPQFGPSTATLLGGATQSLDRKLDRSLLVLAS